MRANVLGRVLLYALLGVFALWYLVPLVVMLLNSVKPLTEIEQGNMVFLPQMFTLDPWRAAWSTAQIGVEATGLKPYFLNSLYMVVPAVRRSRRCSARSTATCSRSGASRATRSCSACCCSPASSRSRSC